MFILPHRDVDVVSASYSQWMSGKPNGKGRYRFANGDLYNGAFVEGIIAGALFYISVPGLM